MFAVHPEHWDKSKGGGTAWPAPPSLSGAGGKHRRGNWSAGQQREGESSASPEPMHVPSGNGVQVLGPSLVRMGAVGAVQVGDVVVPTLAPSLDSASAAMSASGVWLIATTPPLERPDESSASSPVRLHADASDASERATRRTERHTKRIPLALCNAWTQADLRGVWPARRGDASRFASAGVGALTHSARGGLAPTQLEDGEVRSAGFASFPTPGRPTARRSAPPRSSRTSVYLRRKLPALPEHAADSKCRSPLEPKRRDLRAPPVRKRGRQPNTTAGNFSICPQA